MTGSRRIEETAKAFWKTAGGRRKFGSPIDLERAVAIALPLGICRMPALSTAKVAAVLERSGQFPGRRGRCGHYVDASLPILASG